MAAVSERTLANIGPRLRAARVARQLTQEGLAKKIGVDQTTVSDWERGYVIPPVVRLVAVCAVLGLVVASLLEPHK